MQPPSYFNKKNFPVQSQTNNTLSSFSSQAVLFYCPRLIPFNTSLRIVESSGFAVEVEKMSPSNTNCSGAGDGSGFENGCSCRYIEHQVSKMDTLAGIAIKYGVEVADLKRMNGLAVDFQVFALKTLRIPLPGRHPPASCLPLGSASSSGGKSSEKGLSLSVKHWDLSKSSEPLRSKSSQHKAYPPISSTSSEFIASNVENSVQATDMTHTALSACDATSKYRNLGIRLLEDGAIANLMPISDTAVGGDNGLHSESVRKSRQTEPDVAAEMLLKEENSSGSSNFFSTRGMALALRTKSASRTSLAMDVESNWTNSIQVGARDITITDENSGLHRSSSMFTLQVQDTSNSSSIRQAPKWNIKPDLQLFSAASIAAPIFDGLSLPITISGWRSKAARD